MGVKNKASWISKSYETVHRNRSGLFAIDNVLIEDIANQITPPFYVYDTKTIKNKYVSLQKVLSRFNFKIYYAIKPNPVLAIVDELYKLGAGLDVASLGELLIAQKVKANGDNVSFAGPVKTNEAIKFAIDYGIHIINAESEDELLRINAIAGEKGSRQTVALRVNVKHVLKNTPHQVMAGYDSKFGIDEDHITVDFVKKIQKLPNLNLTGIHVYAANMLDTDSFLENIINICNVAQRLNKYFKIKSIDFGGGLSVPYLENQEELDLNKINNLLGGILSRYPFIENNNVELSIEPGRYLVAQSGIYVTKVENIKESGLRKYVLVDGGIHHFLRPILVGSNHPIYNLSRITDKSEESTTLGGALCTPIDILHNDVLLPKRTNRGNLIGVFIAGAYGWSEAMPYFMSMQTAAEVLVHDKKFYLIRPSEHPSLFLKKQIIPKGISYV